MDKDIYSRSDEGLRPKDLNAVNTLNTHGAIWLAIQLVTFYIAHEPFSVNFSGQFTLSTQLIILNCSKLPCYTLPPTQHHSFFRNLFPYKSSDSHDVRFWWKIYVKNLKYDCMNIDPYLSLSRSQFQLFFFLPYFPYDIIGKFITWRVNSALNRTREPISHESRSIMFTKYFVSLTN